MKYPAICFILLAVLLFQGCFEEDMKLDPYVSPYTVVELDESIYTHQIYVDLETGRVVSMNPNTDWVLAFECSAEGTQVRVNSSDLWEMSATGLTDFNAVDWNGTFIWSADRSDGDPDSTVTANWVQSSESGNAYSNEVYMLGKYDGIGYPDKMKLQLLYVDSVMYRFAMEFPEAAQPDTFVVWKDTSYNYVQFSPETGTTLRLEPPKDQWDLLFSQYHSILFTDDSVATPYYVRGTLLNPYHVLACLDTINSFDDIDYSIASGQPFSEQQDIIGHDWKSVSVDEGTNSAVYTVREGYTYLVKDSNEKIYKLRFISFLGSTGVKGYPSFEVAELEE